MKLLFQKIAALLRSHARDRQPPPRQSEFQFRPRVLKPTLRFATPVQHMHRCQAPEWTEERQA